MRRFLSVLAILALVVFAGACGDSGDGPTTPRRFNTTGRWTGAASGATITVTLNESSGNITGSGSLSGSGESLALNVTGNNAVNAVSLTMTAPGFEPVNFTGNITSATVMGGSLNGSGFNNFAMTFTKQ
jgi:hypothetical protein